KETGDALSGRRGHSLLERLEAAQLRYHLGAEEPDRAHEILFAEIAEIELAEESVEDAFLGPGAQLLRHRLGRADEDAVMLHQPIGIEEIAHSLGRTRLAALLEKGRVLMLQRF